MFERIRYYYGAQSVGLKLLLFVIVIIFVVVIFLTVPYVILYGKSTMDSINNQAIQNNRQLKNSTKGYFESLETTIDNFNKNQNVNFFLDNSYDYKMQKEEIEENIKKELYDIKAVNKEVIGIAVINFNGDIISNDMIGIGTSDITQDQWYIKSIGNKDKIFIDSNSVGRNIRSIYDYYSSEAVISLSKALVDTSNGKVKGAVLFDVKLSTIQNIYENAGIGEESFFYIVNTNDEVIYAPVNDIVYRVDTGWMKGESGKGTRRINSVDYQINYVYASYIDSYVVSVFSLEESQSSIVRLTITSVVFAVLMMLVASYFAYITTNNFKKRISDLKSKMQEAEDGKLDARFLPKYSDEISQLGQSFNQMLSSIEMLVKQVELDQKTLRKSELRTFQMQIKPHFLYNTLDTINWMAQEYDAEEISDLVLDLTTFFRLSLNNGKEFISLNEELEQIRSYMEIQKVRYVDEFDFFIECNNDFSDYMVIKLILQPIIENSIYHGIRPKLEKGYIRVTVEKEDDKVIFMISDNGVGIDKEKTKIINKGLLNGETDKTDKFGVGIYNVNERIRLSFGSEYGLNVEGELNIGTTVTITHPIVRK